MLVLYRNPSDHDMDDFLCDDTSMCDLVMNICLSPRSAPGLVLFHIHRNYANGQFVFCTATKEWAWSLNEEKLDSVENQPLLANTGTS